MTKKQLYAVLILLIFLISINVSANKNSQNLLEELNNNQESNKTINTEHPWPMFRHDTKHTGRTEVTGPATPTIAWKFHVDNEIVSSAAISRNDTIYVGTGWNLSSVQAGSLYAFYSNGTLKWKHTVNNGFFSSPARVSGKTAL